MPLQSGKSDAVVSANIEKLVGEGREPKQAAAIAYSTAGRDSAAGIMYQHGGKILLMKRAANADQGGTWGFVGGRLEGDETPEQAAIRESGEETGHFPESAIVPFADDGSYVTFICREDFQPILNDEHTDCVWAGENDLPSPLHPGVTALLSSIFPQSAREADINGWVSIENNPISRSGVFQYSGRAIGDADQGRVFNVYRPEEELNNPETIESFKLVPFINNHPSTLLGQSDNDMPNVDGKPADGVIGEKVYFANGFLYGNLKFFTDRIMQEINAGKIEISAGFRCMYEKVSGVFNGQAYDYIQRSIRGNHVALVNEGRMGAGVAVLDHFTMTFDAKELIMAGEEAVVAAPSGDMTMAEVTAQLKNIVPMVQEMQGLIAKLKELEAEEEGENEGEGVLQGMDARIVAQDAAIAALTADVAALKAVPAPSGMDAKQVFAVAADRDRLYSAVSPLIGSFDASGMDAQDVAVYAAGKFGLTVAPEQATVAVTAYLAAKPSIQSQKAAFGLDGASDGKSPISAAVEE